MKERVTLSKKEQGRLMVLNEVEAGKITLREPKVVYSCGWQAFDEVAQVIAKIANCST
jgi:hypothetical protein